MSVKKCDFKVKFRGIRGSHPVSSQNILKYGGNTSCVEVRVNGHLIIIDAGTGIIELGNELAKSHIASGTAEDNREPVEALMLFTHAHYDHIQGFPFFKPMYIGNSKIYIYGPESCGINFEQTLFNSMLNPFFPLTLGEMRAHRFINNFNETETIILPTDKLEPELRKVYSDEYNGIPDDAVIITCIKSSAHPKDGVLVFKISCNGYKIVFATDKESYMGGDSRLISFARNADLLIHDTQYTFEDYSSQITSKQGFGHSTPEMAIEIARLANVKKLAFYHFDPFYDDNFVDIIDENAKKDFPDAFAAYEGLEIDITC